MNKNWEKINLKEKSKIKGGASLMVLWGMSLITLSIVRSLFSNKSNLAINGFGKASWEDQKQTSNSLSKMEKIQIGLKNFFE